ncbi:hypothetical protein BEWA_037160 [Theileria equi strain WA]|uniref:Signal peptide containing protein n=1 Tax=Theileria equi strain WA TaxID=1537102 RepID=L1LEK0_THEEQ|nr:hypothetical protein BEWA_037160 [Theileria equi strain WA]EKX73680.1 hypothetical protein BEWA_037160 [Theileria equi strain WA]|eukprot:XP_004833132.1 hypothetical protein BEWA_037160 [Theileria equi strain WA]
MLRVSLLSLLVTRDKNNKQGKVYRYHDGKQWKDGKEGDHKKKLGELKKCESEPALSDEEPELQQGYIPPRQKPVWASVDLSKEPEQEKVDYYNSVTGDVSYKRYSSKFSNNDTDQILLVKKVTDNGNTIWEAGERECMELAQYRSKGGFAILRIHVNVCGDVKHKFFEKNAEKWEEILKAFDDKLLKMMHKESNKPEPQEPKTR